MNYNKIKVSGDNNIVIQDSDIELIFDVSKIEEINKLIATFPNILHLIQNQLEEQNELKKCFQELCSLIKYKLSHIENRISSLQLVDVSIVEENKKLPILDIKVLNNSNEPIFIKCLEFSTLGYWEIIKDVNFSLVPVSYTYDFELPQSKGLKKFSISQGVPPNYFDRFRIILKGSNKGVLVGASPYLFNFRLIYNSDNKSVLSPNILLHIPPTNFTWAGFAFKGWTKERLRSNKKVASEILSLIDKNTIVSDSLINALESWKAITDQEINSY